MTLWPVGIGMSEIGDFLDLGRGCPRRKTAAVGPDGLAREVVLHFDARYQAPGGEVAWQVVGILGILAARIGHLGRLDAKIL